MSAIVALKRYRKQSNFRIQFVLVFDFSFPAVCLVSGYPNKKILHLLILIRWRRKRKKFIFSNIMQLDGSVEGKQAISALKDCGRMICNA